MRSLPEPVFLNDYGAQTNLFQGMNTASLCSLAGRDDKPIPTRFLAPIAVFRIRSRIHRIHMFLGFQDPDPLVGGMNPDPDPSIIMLK